MSDLSKYDLFMNELHSMEKKLYSYIQQVEVMNSERTSLNGKMVQLEKENELLKQKVKDLEAKLTHPLAGGIGGKIDFEDSDNLKEKITDLLSKIDYHLRS